MVFVEYLKTILEGRGFFASFLVISGWFYAFVILLVLICNIILYVMGEKYYDIEFINQVVKEAKEAGDSFSVATRYAIKPELVARWIKKHKDG